MNEEREKLVEALMLRYVQPTLPDAVIILKFQKLQSVVDLLELDGQLRKMWWQRRDTWPLEA